MSRKKPLKYCGIDVSKKTLVCAAISDLTEHNRHYLPGQASDLGIVYDEPVVTREFQNSWNGIISMTKWMETIGVTVAVMESTGIYWCAAFTAIEKVGIQPVLANARQVKNISVQKTDLKDCVWLAVLLRAGFIRPSYVPKGIFKDLRDATRMRVRLKKDLARTKNRCHSVLDTLLVDLGLSNAFGKGGRRTLLRALDGNYENLTEEQKRSFESVSAIQRLMICDHVEAMGRLDERIKRYEAEIARLVEELQEKRGDDDVGLLITVPGMALTSATIVKAEIGTIERFNDPGRLCSYFGLVPRTHQSGPVHRKGKIAKHTNKFVRSTMFLAARTCAQVGPRDLREFHARIQKKKGYYPATIALARRMMVVIWRMLKDKVPFKDAHDRGLTERKETRYRREIKRLKKLERKYGGPELLEMVQQLISSETPSF